MNIVLCPSRKHSLNHFILVQMRQSDLQIQPHNHGFHFPANDYSRGENDTDFYSHRMKKTWNDKKKLFNISSDCHNLIISMSQYVIIRKDITMSVNRRSAFDIFRYCFRKLLLSIIPHDAPEIVLEFHPGLLEVIMLVNYPIFR